MNSEQSLNSLTTGSNDYKLNVYEYNYDKWSTAFHRKYRATVTRLETPVSDVLSVLCYNYSNLVDTNYWWLC